MLSPVPLEWRGGAALCAPAQAVYCAGYAGRDQASVRKHIEELAAIGVPAPAKTPTYYRVSPHLVTTSDVVQVLGDHTSGEVEFAVFRAGGEDYVTVASDHTDRETEKISVPLAKQLCPKVLAPLAWNVRQVADRWDGLRLRSWISARDGSDRRLYQDGTVGQLMTLTALRTALHADTGADPLACLLLSGTVPVVGGETVFAARFEIELLDPTSGSALRHAYRVETF